MFSRSRTKAPIPTQSAPSVGQSKTRQYLTLNHVSVGLTALASVGPRRFRPHAQAVLALISAAQAVFTLFRKP